MANEVTVVLTGQNLFWNKVKYEYVNEGINNKPKNTIAVLRLKKGKVIISLPPKQKLSNVTCHFLAALEPRAQVKVKMAVCTLISWLPRVHSPPPSQGKGSEVANDD